MDTRGRSSRAGRGSAPAAPRERGPSGRGGRARPGRNAGSGMPGLDRLRAPQERSPRRPSRRVQQAAPLDLDVVAHPREPALDEEAQFLGGVPPGGVLEELAERFAQSLPVPFGVGPRVVIVALRGGDRRRSSRGRFAVAHARAAPPPDRAGTGSSDGGGSAGRPGSTRGTNL